MPGWLVLLVRHETQWCSVVIHKILHSFYESLAKTSVFLERMEEAVNSSVNKDASAGDRGKVALPRSLGLFHCIGVLAGCIIGTAIFISPTAILRGVNGSVGWSFVLWIASACLGTLEALCFAELGTSFTKSGGEYIYLKESFGPLAAFLRVWSTVIIIGPAMAALQTIVFATFVIAPFLGDCHDLPWLAVRCLAACAMWLIFYINCVSVPLSIRIQSFMTIAKISGLVVLILTGMVFLSRGNTNSFREPFHMDGFKLGGLSSAFLAGRYAFGGWSIMNNLTEEIKKPEKTLPRASFGTLFLVFCIYMLANVSYLTVMTAQEMLASEAVAVTFATRTLNNWSWTIWLCVALSAAGQLNGASLSRARMYFAASREGALPEVLSLIHVRWRTPLSAVAVTLPLSLLMLFVGDIYSLLDFLTCVDTIFTIMSVSSILYFRWKYPNNRRPFKVPLFVPVVFIFINLVIVAMAFYDTPVESLLGIVITAMGVPFYFIGCYWTKRPKAIQKAIDHFYCFLQKLFLSVKQEIKTY